MNMYRIGVRVQGYGWEHFFVVAESVSDAYDIASEEYQRMHPDAVILPMPEEFPAGTLVELGENFTWETLRDQKFVAADTPDTAIAAPYRY